MVKAVVKSEQGGDLFLPPGFRFHPTDEEVITSYLLQKFLNPSFSPLAMGEVDLNKIEPWDLPSQAKMGEKEWYFFSHKDMKYPTGMRTNRATKEGYWKATGKDKEIFRTASDGRELVGMKKTLVFYTGRAPRGSKTDWVMHEYRLEGKSRHNNAFDPKDEWVVCKVHNKKGEAAAKKAAGEECSNSAAGTPNVSSVEAGEGDDDLLIDSMIDYSSLLNFSSAAGSLPATIDAAALYNADYPAGTFATSSFLDLPNNSYSGYDGTAASINNRQQQVAVADPAAAPRNSNGSYTTSSWNTPRHANNNAMGNYYSLQHQAMMAKATGSRVTVPDLAAGLPAVSSSVSRILQQNSLGAPVPQQKLGNYGDSAATATNIGATAKDLGAQLH